MVYLEALEATQYLSQLHLLAVAVVVVKVKTLQQLVVLAVAVVATVQQVSADNPEKQETAVVTLHQRETLAVMVAVLLVIPAVAVAVHQLLVVLDRLTLQLHQVVKAVQVLPIVIQDHP
jgi:hypothetical protein